MQQHQESDLGHSSKHSDSNSIGVAQTLLILLKQHTENILPVTSTTGKIKHTTKKYVTLHPHKHNRDLTQEVCRAAQDTLEPQIAAIQLVDASLNLVKAHAANIKIPRTSPLRTMDHALVPMRQTAAKHTATTLALTARLLLQHQQAHAQGQLIHPNMLATAVHCCAAS